MTDRMRLAMLLDEVEEWSRKVATRFAEDERVDDGCWTRYLQVNLNPLEVFAERHGLEFDRGLALQSRDVCRNEWKAALEGRGFVHVECKDHPSELTAIVIRYERPWMGIEMAYEEDFLF